MLKFAVFVSGGGTDLQSIIDAKNEGKINGEIALVLSNRQKAYGLQRAKDAGIETVVVKKDDALIVKMLKERNPKPRFAAEQCPARAHPLRSGFWPRWIPNPDCRAVTGGGPADPPTLSSGAVSALIHRIFCESPLPPYRLKSG